MASHRSFPGGIDFFPQKVVDGQGANLELDGEPLINGWLER